jgi:hypothetical protein
MASLAASFLADFDSDSEEGGDVQAQTEVSNDQAEGASSMSGGLSTAAAAATAMDVDVNPPSSSSSSFPSSSSSSSSSLSSSSKGDAISDAHTHTLTQNGVGGNDSDSKVTVMHAEVDEGLISRASLESHMGKINKLMNASIGHLNTHTDVNAAAE